MTFKKDEEVVLKAGVRYKNSYNESSINRLAGSRLIFYNRNGYLNADCCVICENGKTHYIYLDQIEKHPKYKTKLGELL